MTTGAIIVAAGRSSRMGGIDKLLETLGGRPLLGHSLAVFATHNRVDRLIVVVSPSGREAIESLAGEAAPRAKIVLGGDRRRDSVKNGLDALIDCDLVVVHDGARPFVTAELIDTALDGAIQSGASLCAVPVTDTVKRADEAGLVRGTVSRDRLWLAQTPQAFRTDVLRRAHASSDINATDDAALVELIEEPVRVVMGSRENIKVTTPEDLVIARGLLLARSGYTET